jgi:SPP1 gp7 family putative phage head morphogenesis protein
MSEEIKLKPLINDERYYDFVERKIIKVLKTEIYLPLIKELGVGKSVLRNSRDDLLEAIRTGRIDFYRGQFNGRFNAKLSRELRALGARWDRKTGTFKIPQASLPYDVRYAISASESNFQSKLAAIDRKLAQILPAEIAEKIKLTEFIDQTLWKVGKDFRASVKNITVEVEPSKEQNRRLAEEYQQDMERYIKDWSETAIKKLRKDVQASVFAGERNDVREKKILKVIGDSHQSSVSKARFLARQETNLLLTKYKQARYEDAGVEWYEWRISNHPIQGKNAQYLPGQVRHDHGRLAGKYFKWNDPPISDDATGAKNNPRQDFNCRCNAIPVLNPKGKIRHGFGCTYMEK